jgi:lipopolysaccharide export system permease protein
VNLDALKIDEDEEFEKLNHYTDDSLINIVKNAKQFSYSSDFRNKALKILSNRGITQQDLFDTNNLYNKEYQELDRLNQAYKVQNNITLVTYFITLILSVFSSKLNPILILISIITIILFYIFLYKSHQTLEEMGKLIGRKVNVGLVLTFLVGFPFFILLYFYIKTVIKEAMTQYR